MESEGGVGAMSEPADGFPRIGLPEGLARSQA
jgi:hypothetical protein